ncbi:RNA polymerase sigma factor [Patescibacteria group bacterium]|nr:RNA polymerase sigma factor [Patescibacteria group bacterium]
MQDDNFLVQKIQNGEKELFSVLYEKYCHKILSFLFYKCGDMSQAEDLAGEAFLKAFDGIKSFRPQREKAFSSWLYTIATNVFLDSVKRKKESSLDDKVELIPDEKVGDMTHNLQVGQQAEEILAYLDSL